MIRRKKSQPVDPFTGALKGYFDTAASQSRSLAYGVLIVVFLFAALLFYVQASETRRDDSLQALENATTLDVSLQALVEASGVYLEVRAKAYEGVIETYGASPPALRARYRAALLHYREARREARDENSDKAKHSKRLKQVVDLCRLLNEQRDRDVPERLSMFNYELWGLALEDLGEYKQAVDIYSEAQTRHGESFLARKFYYHIAKCYYALGDNALALINVNKALGQTEDMSLNNAGQEWEWRARAEFLQVLARGKPVVGVPTAEQFKAKKEAEQDKPNNQTRLKKVKPPLAAFKEKQKGETKKQAGQADKAKKEKVGP